jgi:hypothetical protein
MARPSQPHLAQSRTCIPLGSRMRAHAPATREHRSLGIRVIYRTRPWAESLNLKDPKPFCFGSNSTPQNMAPPSHTETGVVRHFSVSADVDSVRPVWRRNRFVASTWSR